MAALNLKLAALAAMITSMGAGGGVYLAEKECTSLLRTEYLQTVAANHQHQRRERTGHRARWYTKYTFLKHKDRS